MTDVRLIAISVVEAVLDVLRGITWVKYTSELSYESEPMP